MVPRMVHVGYIEAWHELDPSGGGLKVVTPAWEAAKAELGFSPCGTSGGCVFVDPNLSVFGLVPDRVLPNPDWGGCVQDGYGSILKIKEAWFPDGRAGIDHRKDYDMATFSQHAVSRQDACARNQ